MSDTETSTWTWNLSNYELELTQEKLAKINARAAKKGLGAGSLELEVVKTFEVTETDEHSGFEITRVVNEVAITGTAPQLNGWAFIAVLDFDKNAGLITKVVPGYEGKIDRSGFVEGACDHCHVNRYRKTTYLVQHEDGTTKQVGSTCIRDFLGQEFSPTFIYAKDSEELAEELGFGGYGGYGDADVTIETALAVAWAAVTEYGFVKSNAAEFGGGEVPTKTRISQVLFPANKEPLRSEHLAVGAKLRPLAEQAKEQAKLIRDYLLSDAFAGDNEYVVNLKAILSADRVSSRFFGLLASAPQAWARGVERDLKRQAETSEIKNEFFGETGDKVELTVQVKSIRSTPGYAYNSPATAIYTLVTDDGHLAKWFTGTWALGEEVTNHTFKIKGSIKKFDEYNGTKSTVLTRVKVLEDIAPSV
jgi:hypothetical protein